jgi:hypothetical protein
MVRNLFSGAIAGSPYTIRKIALLIVPQLDQLVGLAMLVAASVVFLYYTIWTLLMVRIVFFSSASNHEANDMDLAICRLGSCPTESIPSASLGNQDSRYSHTVGFCCGGIVFKCGYDSKQQEAGCEGQSRHEEEGLGGWDTGAFENSIEEKEENKIYMVARNHPRCTTCGRSGALGQLWGDLVEIGKGLCIHNYAKYNIPLSGSRQFCKGMLTFSPLPCGHFFPHLYMC